MSAAVQPRSDAIPQSFWYTPDVAAALSQWDLPAVVRLMHQKLGLTQMALANLTGYSQANISRWLNREGSPRVSPPPGCASSLRTWLSLGNYSA